MSSEEVKKTVISSRGVCGNGHVVWTTPPTSSKCQGELAPALPSMLAKAAGCQWYSGGSSKLAALARDPAAAPGIR
jgi:hypothetical protein